MSMSSDPHVESAAPSAEPAHYELAGDIGAELAQPLTQLQSLLEPVLLGRPLAPEHILALQAQLSDMKRLVRHSQWLAQLSHPDLMPSTQPLRLDMALQRVLDRYDGLRLHRAVELSVHAHPMVVEMDPFLLDALLEAALCWSGRPGYRVHVQVDLPNWPQHALLRLKAEPLVSASRASPSAAPSHLHQLSWHLMVEAASRAGVALDHVESENTLSLTLEFPRTQSQIEQLSAGDVSNGRALPSDVPPHAIATTSGRLLLLTADDGLQRAIDKVCSGLGQPFDTVPTVSQAVRLCELEPPALLVVDERLKNEALQTLREDLNRYVPGFPTVEITQDPNARHLPGLSSDSLTRLAATEVPTQLRDVLTRLLTS